jgi:hypothetical protein
MSMKGKNKMTVLVSIPKSSKCASPQACCLLNSVQAQGGHQGELVVSRRWKLHVVDIGVAPIDSVRVCGNRLTPRECVTYRERCELSDAEGGLKVGAFISRSPPIGTDQHRSAPSGPISPEMYRVDPYATGTKLILALTFAWMRSKRCV